MANGKVKKYFKNLEKMMREGVNVPKPKKKDVDVKTNLGRVAGVEMGTEAAQEAGKAVTGIKEHGPLEVEAKRAGKVNLDNVKKVKHPHSKRRKKHTILAGAKEDDKYVLQKNGKNKTKTPAPASPSPVTPVTPASPSPVSVYNNKQRGKIAKDVYGHYDDVSKLKEMTDKDIDHLVKKYQVNLKTEKKTEKKSKKNNKKKGR